MSSIPLRPFEFTRPPRGATGLVLAVLASGAAGLSWEALWQHHAGLALGVSAFGIAITLSSLMAGLGLGGLLASRLARRGRLRRPLVAYGLAELGVGIGGLLIPAGLDLLATIDVWVYEISPTLAAPARLAGTGLLLLVPATAMGTTIPILAPYATRVGMNVALVYALNIAGAVFGVLAMTFFILPEIGATRTGWLAAGLNVAVALWAISRRGALYTQPTEPATAWPPAPALALAGMSGFAIFVLEVSWFRSLRAALQSTTESFAMILAAFLVGLSLGAGLASLLRRRSPSLPAWLIAAAGFSVLCITPAIDGFDRLADFHGGSPMEPAVFTLRVAARRFALLLGLVLVPSTLLGAIFPWVLSEHATTSGAGRLYAVNTAGAVLGALLGGFVMLPWIGATLTSWVAAAVVLGGAIVQARGQGLRIGLAAASAAALFAANAYGTDGARMRVQGAGAGFLRDIHFVSEGPDTTVWVGPSDDPGKNVLIIDGFIAAVEGPEPNYTDWMAHIPALAAPRMEDVLVICFGTGQTTDAVREHLPDRLTVADINPAVFAAAHWFRSNHGVLQDPRVRAVVSDGRAFLRRAAGRQFDMVTLEPMPPNFAGSNALYSLEFYELIRSRLAPDGAVGQWLPFHMTSPDHMRSIIATFRKVFPFARLWIDAGNSTGILVGSQVPWEIRQPRVPIPLSVEHVEMLFLLDWDETASISRGAELITDDNQLLSYGLDRFDRADFGGREWVPELYRRNYQLLRAHRRRPVPPEIRHVRQ